MVLTVIIPRYGFPARAERGFTLIPAAHNELQSSEFPAIAANSLSDLGDFGYLTGEMQRESDAKLLRKYAEFGAENAFAEIVNRHTNLVYSAALRQVNSTDTAAEVTQSVFIGLAQSARVLSARLSDDASLAGWLCRSARNIALNIRRGDYRRHSRERLAMENLESHSDAAVPWDHLCPVLDQAMAELSEPDNDALVMRFFENQDLRSIGLALGVSDDAAQKRVSRALDRLRELLLRRKVTATTATLCLLLPEHAVQAAPPGLAASISTSVAGTAIQASSTALAAKAVAMTTLQKTIVGAVLATAIGFGIYENRLASRLGEELNTERANRTSLAEKLNQLQRERDNTTERLTASLAELELLKSDDKALELMRLRGRIAGLDATRRDEQNDPVAATAREWLSRVQWLKNRVEETPGAKIPEFRFLTEKDWVEVAKDADLETEDGIKLAFSRLRFQAVRGFAPRMQSALDTYVKKSGGQLPTEISQLKTSFEPPVEDSVLERYRLLKTGHLRDIPAGTDVIEEIPFKPYDAQHLFWAGSYLKGSGWTGNYRSTANPWVWTQVDSGPPTPLE
jgi:RNA polymerase sigma factor (sigma-70 family)